MKCPHCSVEIHAKVTWVDLPNDKDGWWGLEMYKCPNPECLKNIFYLVLGKRVSDGRGTTQGYDPLKKRIQINPKGANRPPVHPDVPTDFTDDYLEACLVLPDSPKASAALSRRCLQHLLREVSKVKHSNLYDEIQEAIDSKALPTHITDILDAVRVVGNFAAHPMKSQQTGEIIEVEPGEAELNLDVLEALFDFYFVQPAVIAKKRAAIDQKLKEAGKPPMK